MTTLSRRLGWTLVALSLLIHVVTVYAYSRQPDQLAAFTVMPIWLWGGIGLFLSVVAFYFLRASLSLILTGVWAVTLLVGADEARVLAHFGKEPPLPGPAEFFKNQRVIRVLTLNCATFSYGNPAPDIAAWQPDIVLLQDAFPHQVRQVADALYGGGGDYRAQMTNGIVTRWEIKEEVRPVAGRNQQVTGRNQQVTIRHPGGAEMVVVNVHLRTAATDLRLWDKSAWVAHKNNRVLRQQELAVTLQILEDTVPFPNIPVIFGGDFNAPATDLVHRQLTPDFNDAFASAGTGWGNTYQRRFPILRIDHLYATRHFTPLRSRVVTTRNSDHRMVIADFLPGPSVAP